MAQFALSGGMSLIDKLQIISLEINREGSQSQSHDVEDVRKWLNTIQDYLNTTKAYLNDTEGREGTNGFKDRKQQVRKLAFQIEDAIDEFMLQVPEHIHHHGFTKWLHDRVHSIKDSKPIKKLFSRMKDIESEIKKLKDLDPIREVASTSCPEDIPPEPYLFHNDENLVGIVKGRNELHSLLLEEESSLRDVVVSVVGQDGSGKTSLIHEVYEMEKATFHCDAWVPVRRPFDLERLLEKICEAMELRVPHGTDRRRRLSSFLQQKRYILVLDGIWSEDEWNNIKSVLPSNNQGSRIVVSTRNRNLASYCATSSNYIYELDPLTWEEAFELFCKKAFKGTQCPEDLVELSEKIVKRCEGLPDAIVEVGTLLSNKPHTMKEFKYVHDSLEYEPGTHVGHSYIRKILQNYYRLSPNLKSCFLYFCNFPEDFSVAHGRLVHLWIAEGFIEEKNGKTLEEVADEYLDELVQMSLVRVSTWDFEGRIRSCRVSNLVRGFILSKSEKEKLCIILRTSDTSLGEKPRCLSLHNCFPDVSKIKDLSRVRTFFVFGEDIRSEPMARELLSNFRYLKVLDLENADLVCFPREIANLILLKYLSLKNTKIKLVPKSVKKLQDLMILDLRQTLLTKLPREILELHKLLYLLVDCRDMYHASVGAEVSPGIGGLTLLQKLSFVKANKSTVKELEKMVNLRKLGVTELKEEDGKDLCESIEKMTNLSSLHVTSASKAEYLDLNHFRRSPPRQLKRLFLGGRLEKTPKWICSLSTLFKIELRWSKMENSPLEALGALPSLKELLMCDAYRGEVLEFEAEWFQELRRLEIEQFNQLQTVVIQEQAMPNLQKLILRNCDSLSMVCLATTCLTHMEEMRIPQGNIHFPGS